MTWSEGQCSPGGLPICTPYTNTHQSSGSFSFFIPSSVFFFSLNIRLICNGISDGQTGCRRRRMEHRWNLRILCTGRSRLALIMAVLPMGPKCCLPSSRCHEPTVVPRTESSYTFLKPCCLALCGAPRATTVRLFPSCKSNVSLFLSVFTHSALLLLVLPTCQLMIQCRLINVLPPALHFFLSLRLLRVLGNMLRGFHSVAVLVVLEVMLAPDWLPSDHW